jgi:hypothetical protein
MNWRYEQPSTLRGLLAYQLPDLLVVRWSKLDLQWIYGRMMVGFPNGMRCS